LSNDENKQFNVSAKDNEEIVVNREWFNIFEERE
jgi:hypothetical protein